ncbi:MAG: hypothetical protein DMG18_14535, partial [Acidobacteria bacterium]
CCPQYRALPQPDSPRPFALARIGIEQVQTEAEVDAAVSQNRSRRRSDGKELYFVAPDGKLMAASITAAGATFSAATPTPLFPVTLAPPLGANNQQYAVSRDGRFLINQPVETSTAVPITLILNWKAKP